MAEYQTLLKPNAWIDPLSLADHLDIKHIKIDVIANKAEVNIQDILWQAILGGIEGNDYSVEYTIGAVAGSEVVSTVANKIVIQIEDGVSLNSQIKIAFDAFVVANPLSIASNISASIVSDLSPNGVVATPLIGGTNPDSEHASTLRKLERFINRACSRIEQYIDTSAMAKCFQEDLDANNSNVIVPTHWPVKRIHEIKIDFNRQFSSFTKLLPENYFLRGTPDRNRNDQEGEISEVDMCTQILNGSVDINLIGNDIVLRDDNERFIVGRIFAGSSLGSIRVTYDAGWIVGKESSIDEDTGTTVFNFSFIPDDLEYAATLLCEWWYFQRDRKDLGITSKGVRGENYSKIETGMPSEIQDILEAYRDFSFGQHNTPQRNIMLDIDS